MLEYSEPPTFPARIRRRYALWWELRRDGWSVHRARSLVDRCRQHYTLLSRDDPDEAWRRGIYWQRVLSNKWNAREFAARHGCRVPRLYWHGRNPRALPLDTLPGRYVLRVTRGSRQLQVYVFDDGRELLRNKTFTHNEIRAALRRQLSRWKNVSVLAEEFVLPEDETPGTPLECSFYAFRGALAAVEVKRRGTGNKIAGRFYTAAWEPFAERLSCDYREDDPLPPPRCLDEMRTAAATLSKAYENFVRIDFFASAEGCIFGEFCPTPKRGYDFTPFGDAWLNRHWEEHCPGTI